MLLVDSKSVLERGGTKSYIVLCYLLGIAYNCGLVNDIVCEALVPSGQSSLFRQLHARGISRLSSANVFAILLLWPLMIEAMFLVQL